MSNVAIFRVARVSNKHHSFLSSLNKYYGVTISNQKGSLRLCAGNQINSNRNKRTYFSFLGSNGSRTKEYSESKIIGYSMEQMYDVVANVDDYKYFVPWCVASSTFEKSETHARANLEVGFPPLSEKYTSLLTLTKPNLVKSDCMDGSLFNHLTCNWRFSKGPSDVLNSCTLNFYVSFEFKSVLHSQLSTMFFDEVARKMVTAFESRCHTMYGPSSLINTKYDPTKKRIRPTRRINKRVIKPNKLKPDGS